MPGQGRSRACCALALLPVEVSKISSLTCRPARVQLSFWRDTLRGAPLLWQFPTDKPRPAIPGGKGARVPLQIPVEQVRVLRELAAKVRPTGCAGASRRAPALCTCFAAGPAGCRPTCKRWPAGAPFSPQVLALCRTHERCVEGISVGGPVSEAPLVHVPSPHRPWCWSAELCARARSGALRAQAKSTLFMVLLAAYKVLLARHLPEDDLVVGVPHAGRTRAEFEGLVGPFMGAVGIRSSFAQGQTFLELLAHVRQARRPPATQAGLLACGSPLQCSVRSVQARTCRCGAPCPRLAQQGPAPVQLRLRSPDPSDERAQACTCPVWARAC